MFNFFIIFTACFSAIIFHWIIIMFLETRLPVIALFVDKRYYYLCFFHSKILNMRLDGKDETTILEEIRKLNFPFFIFPNKKSMDYLSYVRELVQRDDLVKRYLFSREFRYSSFRRLIHEFNTPMEANKRAAHMALWELVPDPSDERVEKLMTLFATLLTPAFVGSDDNPKLSPGENELNVYTAAKRAGAVKEDCTLGAFASCMLALKLAHSEMQIVKGKQGLSKHGDKTINLPLIEALEKRFRETIE